VFIGRMTCPCGNCPYEPLTNDPLDRWNQTFAGERSLNIAAERIELQAAFDQHREPVDAEPEIHRILGFGSYQTAWTWLHKLRAAMVREDREPLDPLVQIDEALVG
jgi:hypothetical protein